MSGLSAAAQEAIDAIEAGPQGPSVGAFFDLDGTLVAGYTAATFYGDRLKGRDVSPAEFLRTVVTAVDGELGGDPTRIAHVAFSAMRGESEEAFADLGERLFRSKIAGTIRLDHAKRHYYESHRTLNPSGIVPLGPCPPRVRDELAVLALQPIKR